MKILFYRYGSICEVDIIRCMDESGHKYKTIETEIMKKNLTGPEVLELVNRELSDASYDCVFSVNFYPAISDLCNIYHIRYVCWVVDSPVLELFASSISNPWNRVFVFDRAQYEEIHALNPGCIFHFPLAADVTSKQKVISDSVAAGTADRFASDVSFVGSLYTEKDPMAYISYKTPYVKGYIEGLCEAQLRVYGYWFAEDLLNDRVVTEFKDSVKDFYIMKADNHLTDRIVIGQYYLGNHITALERQKLLSCIAENHTIDVYTRSDTAPIRRANCRGGCMTETEMPVIFNRSRININPTSKGIRSGIPLRVFDIFACEGFMISNYQPELCELFSPGEDFAYYESVEQVPELIAYYLEHEGERAEIAHNAYMKVKEKFSYIVRFNELLLTAFEQ